MTKIESYRTLRVPVPEGNVALIFPETLTAETAAMLLEIFAAQFERYRKERDMPAVESHRAIEGDQQ